ncbi:hypothetical protein TNCV_1730501 [Trichonephila clavipes]|nr:hypothetical protein TNCV_1730501 [Trichonephila clavipes]
MGDEQPDQWGEFLSCLRLHFFPASLNSKITIKARLPIARETLGHWSSESLVKILGRRDGPAELAIQYIFIFTLILTRASKELNAIPQVLRQEIKISTEIRCSDNPTTS